MVFARSCLCVKPSGKAQGSQGSADARIFALLFRRHRGRLPVDSQDISAVRVESYRDDLTGKHGRSGILVLRYADAHYVAFYLAVKVDLAARFDTLDRIHSKHVGYA